MALKGFDHAARICVFYLIHFAKRFGAIRLCAGNQPFYRGADFRHIRHFLFSSRYVHISSAICEGVFPSAEIQRVCASLRNHVICFLA